MNFPVSPVPANAYAYYGPNRPKRAICWHHTATTRMPVWRNGSSTHFVIDRDPPATIYQSVPLDAAAHTILKADIWIPPWLVASPDGRVSPPNYCTVNVEVVFDPSPSPTNPTQIATPAQLASARHLTDYLIATLGVLPHFGHGQIQGDKWDTEPHDWLNHFVPALSLGPFNWAYGHMPIRTNPPATGDDVDPISDEDLKKYLETYGVGVNMSTALIQRAALAYRRGERRGPALTDEYAHTDGHTRQDFTAATADYDPATGGVSWVELNLERQQS